MGRKASGERAMTAAERQRASRERLMYPAEGYGAEGHSGKQLSVMLNGRASMQLSDLVDAYSDLSQKEIVELAIATLYQTMPHAEVLSESTC